MILTWKHVIAVALLCVVPLSSSAYDDKEKKKKATHPKWLVTFYNGGKVVDLIEANDFEAKNSSSIRFEAFDGTEIFILNGCVVARRCKASDYEALSSMRKKTAQMRKLLALRRQEAAIKAEMAIQRDITAEIQKLEDELKEKKPKVAD